MGGAYDTRRVPPGFCKKDSNLHLKMTGPLVSVILATHNRAHLLPEAVQSILAQTWQEFEIIIVDDASKDETPIVINYLAENDDRIRSISTRQNIGPGAARNLGIAQARGEYIAIMDDDDLAYPERLATQLTVFKQNTNISLVFSSVSWVDDRMNILQTFPGVVARDQFPASPDQVFNLIYLESNKIPNATILTKKDLWVTFSYPPQPWIGEDWFLFLQLASSNVLMKAIPQPLLKVRRGQERHSLTASPIEKIFNAQRQVLKMTRAWLAEKNLHEFDHLHRVALSNQILRESRHFVGIKGLWFILQAFIQAPMNPKVVEQLRWYKEKATRRIYLSKS